MAKRRPLEELIWADVDRALAEADADPDAGPDLSHVSARPLEDQARYWKGMYSICLETLIRTKRRSLPPERRAFERQEQRLQELREELARALARNEDCQRRDYESLAWLGRLTPLRSAVQAHLQRCPSDDPELREALRQAQFPEPPRRRTALAGLMYYVTLLTLAAGREATAEVLHELAEQQEYLATVLRREDFENSGGT